MGSFWDGMKTGNDLLPEKGRHESYLIAGGKKDAAIFEPE